MPIPMNSVIEIMRIIAGISIVLLSVYIAAMNAGCVIVSLKNQYKGISKFYSTVPLISLFAVIIAMLILPSNYKSNWFFIIPIVDCGNIMTIFAIIHNKVRRLTSR
jgi:hypothetical protein